ncbi:hypothetical protein GCM10011575_42420 [Microlunatus endophyticus]|uniref:Uncharacterized protein n=1 Tax=Microlunatus endophyticus TaxID=1716077 RepID=A0A917SHE7_9ACTN|nr:hypothetical protein GCM10011575_42420 [Microlunatus endophyticus]
MPYQGAGHRGAQVVPRSNSSTNVHWWVPIVAFVVTRFVSQLRSDDAKPELFAAEAARTLNGSAWGERLNERSSPGPINRGLRTLAQAAPRGSFTTT